jgi:hypothetical protein
MKNIRESEAKAFPPPPAESAESTFARWESIMPSDNIYMKER